VSLSLRITDWTAISDSLLTTGSVHVRGAVEPALAQQLIDATRPPWEPLPAEEGPVRQSGFASGMTVASAEKVVQDLGAAIVRELTNAAEVPLIPAFNEVNWTSYPATAGHISAHRDPGPYGGIIAVMTLLGQATFRAWSGDVLGTPREVLASQTAPTEWETVAGDLILLQATAGQRRRRAAPCMKLIPYRTAIA
jgi:hypothetical protein